MNRAIKIILVMLVVPIIVSCVQPKEVYIKSQFNEKKARKLLDIGVNTIKGSALIRQKGGGIVTCAGNTVSLIPVTKYAKERIKAFYGSSQKGFSSIYNRIVFKKNSNKYLKLVKNTQCDAQGYFEFNNVANGSFFITTLVSWRVGYTSQGGSLMQKVKVKNGEVKNIVLSP